MGVCHFEMRSFIGLFYLATSLAIDSFTLFEVKGISQSKSIEPTVTRSLKRDVLSTKAKLHCWRVRTALDFINQNSFSKNFCCFINLARFLRVML